MGRELCKFFAGLLAGLAYMHAMLGVGASRGTDDHCSPSLYGPGQSGVPDTCGLRLRSI